MHAPSYEGLELLDTPVLIIEADGRVAYANPASESLFGAGSRELNRHRLYDLFTDARALEHAVGNAFSHQTSFIEHDLELTLRNEQTLPIGLTVTPVHGAQRALIELRLLDQQKRIANEERLLLQQHEEALRLQSLVDRMLAPQQRQVSSETNIHEILERVRSIVLAEFRSGLCVRRDYDVSLPQLVADKEQLIQVVLNLVRNAAQAMHGRGNILLKTRICRQVTLARRRYPLALKLQVIDDGPGIPEAIRDHVFYPLVTGRAEGTGLGLTLAQAFVHQHGGAIEFDSRAGHTCFTVTLPFRPEDGVQQVTRP